MVNEINLVIEHKKFCLDNGIDHHKALSDEVFQKWVDYRNSRFPKTEWRRKSKQEYNTLVRISVYGESPA